MKTNYHTHTFRCGHASGTEEDYIKEAIKNKLIVLGFSDHGPFKDDRYGSRMMYSNLNDYIETIRKLKNKYSNEIKIKLGVEIEYSQFDNEYYEELLNTLDYLALGQHFYVDSNKRAYNVYNFTSTKEYIEYAYSIRNAMKTGYFKFLAHPDLPFLHDFKYDDNCKKAIEIIIDSSIKYNFILEFNANGIRKGINNYVNGKRYAYPFKPFWEEVSKTNLKVIVNSDCHNPNQLWDDSMKKAFHLCNKLGLNLIDEIG